MGEVVLLRPWVGLRRRFYSGLPQETLGRITSSALVFAPHQDDETLGCGGTVILKRKMGAPVSFVFMTDGGTSHRLFMDEEKLRRLRKREATEAAMVLGLAPGDVHYLGFADGKLNLFHESAVEKAGDLIRQYRRDEIYVPYQADGLPDHEATFRIVMEAVGKTGYSGRVCEYPVWLWNQWPWVPLRLRMNREGFQTGARMLRSGLGLRVFCEFRSGVFIGEVLERKREALSKHRSQMTVMMPGVPWPTLGDVSEGEFLKGFFQDYEVFRCREV